ncbi:MAG TPA: IS1595 family transposase [Syntrophorhabdaceae bacterium]|nr:IS1595 family transposase [Syntrophorhabdaceae bacterium]
MNINLIDLVEQYKGDESKCRSYIESLKWPNGVICPRCGSPKVYRTAKSGHKFDCEACRYQFTATANTIFHDSHLPIWKWFLAIYLMTESKKGMSANQLKRTLGVSYKTAWYLCHRIRKAMQEATESKPKLKGVVEVDETYVGGNYDPRRKRARHDKQAVIGLLERKGKFESKTIPTNGARILVGIIKDRVDKTATVMTDEARGYKRIDGEYKHESVKHRNEEWRRGNAYTNGVESAWSLFNRSIVGSYHQISSKHMDAYLDEFDWRFNNRENPYLFEDTMIRLLNTPQMEFKELIDKTA